MAEGFNSAFKEFNAVTDSTHSKGITNYDFCSPKPAIPCKPIPPLSKFRVLLGSVSQRVSGARYTYPHKVSQLSDRLPLSNSLSLGSPKLINTSAIYIRQIDTPAQANTRSP